MAPALEGRAKLHNLVNMMPANRNGGIKLSRSGFLVVFPQTLLNLFSETSSSRKLILEFVLGVVKSLSLENKQNRGFTTAFHHPYVNLGPAFKKLRKSKEMSFIL